MPIAEAHILVIDRPDLEAKLDQLMPMLEPAGGCHPRHCIADASRRREGLFGRRHMVRAQARDQERISLKGGHMQRSMWKPVVAATLISGTLDIIFAMILTVAFGRQIPNMLRTVASGPFPAATGWGAGGALLGRLRPCRTRPARALGDAVAHGPCLRRRDLFRDELAGGPAALPHAPAAEADLNGDAGIRPPCAGWARVCICSAPVPGGAAELNSSASTLANKSH